MAQYTFPPLSQPFLDPGGQLQDLAGRKTESSIELEVRSQFSPAHVSVAEVLGLEALGK
jgi:hypothetical protein